MADGMPLGMTERSLPFLHQLLQRYREDPVRARASLSVLVEGELSDAGFQEIIAWATANEARCRRADQATQAASSMSKERMDAMVREGIAQRAPVRESAARWLESSTAGKELLAAVGEARMRMARLFSAATFLGVAGPVDPAWRIVTDGNEMQRWYVGDAGEEPFDLLLGRLDRDGWDRLGERWPDAPQPAIAQLRDRVELDDDVGDRGHMRRRLGDFPEENVDLQRRLVTVAALSGEHAPFAALLERVLVSGCLACGLDGPYPDGRLVVYAPAPASPRQPRAKRRDQDRDAIGGGGGRE